ncbi:MAG: class I lanthipeptide [Kofleriaceae bacterium]|jgi:hypothetical protein
MKKITKKLSFKAETIRNLTGEQLQHVAGGSLSVSRDPGGPVMTIGTSGTSVISISSGTSVISHNPSGGSH